MLHQKPCPPPGKVLKAGSCAELYKALPGFSNVVLCGHAEFHFWFHWNWESDLLG